MDLQFRRSALVRVAPFAFFMAVLALRGFAPTDGSWGFDTRWLYALQAGGTALLLALWWREYGEISRQTRLTLREALFAVAVGVAVFVLWVNLDAPWMSLSTASTEPFVPRTADGGLDWALIVVRIAGAALVVPVMEELFWRSFLMRWIQQPVFESVSPAQVGLRAVVLSTFVFVLAHTLWLAAIVAGLAYAWLYIRTGKLWAAVLAHAVTNGVLGVWVVATGNWQFW
ncbi:CAAX protease [beta proteobacterium AAP121]|nr:CAAX protease [beta proteobacterium AAP65]KPF95936.1 CAAX protease [beta proteobacterium AAP121]